MSNDADSIREEEQIEGQKHDLLYGRTGPIELRLNESAWNRFDRQERALNSYVASVQRLGAVDSRRVLDAGCGDGWTSVILAKRRASVVGFDISREAARLASLRATKNGVRERCVFVVASFYALPFRDSTFSLAIGQSVLHHLQHKAQAARELRRVMQAGSHAVFSEPFGNFLWLERLRLAVPVPSGAPEDPDEWRRQMKYADLAAFEPHFQVSIEEFQLLSRLERILSAPTFVRWLNRLDRWILQRARWLRPFAREILVDLSTRDDNPREAASTTGRKAARLG